MEEQPASSSEQPTAASWCCVEGRVYLIWALSCGFTYFHTTDSAQPAVSAEKSKGFSKTMKSVFGNGASSSKTASANKAGNASKPVDANKPASPQDSSNEDVSSLPSGVGYGGSGWDWIPVPALMKPAAKIPPPPTDEEDVLYERYFRTLADLLPRLSSANEFDVGPSCPDLIQAILTRSPLLVKAAELLRNNCIDDMAKRDGLYKGLLEFLRALSQHPVTLPVIAKPTKLYPRDEQLANYTLGQSKLAGSPPFGLPRTDSGKGKPKGCEETDSLISILRRTADLFRGILQHAATNEDFEGDDGRKILSICSGYTELADDHAANLSQNVIADAMESAPAKEKDSAAESRQSLVSAWHRENCMLDVSEKEMLLNFYFSAMAQSVSCPAKGRMKKLITDLNTMRLSLPEGIFVRHGTSRMDIMKVLIVGPAGTPYEGGLFEFDLFCPATFPQTPPMMRLKTTGCGRVRFNPNLYPDGTGMSPPFPLGLRLPTECTHKLTWTMLVCLSLIGTWGSGQTWNPAHSTLMQVLVSIQGMVFCEEPWYNEPGRELRRNKSASDKENATLQVATIEHAMLHWLKKLPESSTSGKAPEQATPGDTDMYVWHDVVHKHFAANGKTILETIKKRKGKKMVDELTEAMRTRGFLEG